MCCISVYRYIADDEKDAFYNENIAPIRDQAFSLINTGDLQSAQNIVIAFEEFNRGNFGK